MNYWLIKTEPGAYSWADLEKDKKTIWDGIRNFQARNNLKAMRKKDSVLFYHSVKEKCVMGTVVVTKEYFADPTDTDWVAVEVTRDKKLHYPVTLSRIKSNIQLSNMVLVRSSRLSVQPVKKEEFDIVIKMSQTMPNT